MSLYDSFFSDINKDHVYHLIKDVIYQNNKVNIFLDDEYKQIYEKGLDNIFNENNASSLDEINKIVVNETIKLFSDKLNNNTEKEYDSNVKLDYDNLFSERMKQNEIFKNMKTEGELKKEKLEQERLEQERKELLSEQERLEKERLEKGRLVEQDRKELLKQERSQEEQIKIDSVSFQATNIESVEEWRPVHKIVSNKRSHIRSSRYNYVFNLKNNNINIHENSQILKLIIPLEDNYIFNHSIICLSIKELNLNISLELEKELDNNQRTYGVYVPIEAHRFNKPNTESITINITDITNTEYVNYDIINVTKLEISEDTIILNVNSVKDIMKEDYFKVLNLSTNIMELRYLLLEPMKVIKIEKNRLFFKTNYIMNATVVDDIEMKLMNVSNQNIIFFK
tara:strand:- start:17 stop:1207 length:1191 start_codon:yes stop_codon:yes gene_type:complete